jgi:hypothetical protein
VYDGEAQIAAHDGLDLSPAAWTMYRFNVPGRPEINWGVGISIGVRFNGQSDLTVS